MPLLRCHYVSWNHSLKKRIRRFIGLKRFSWSSLIHGNSGLQRSTAASSIFFSYYSHISYETSFLPTTSKKSMMSTKYRRSLSEGKSILYVLERLKEIRNQALPIPSSKWLLQQLSVPLFSIMFLGNTYDALAAIVTLLWFCFLAEVCPSIPL